MMRGGRYGVGLSSKKAPDWINSRQPEVPREKAMGSASGQKGVARATQRSLGLKIVTERPGSEEKALHELCNARRFKWGRMKIAANSDSRLA